MAVLTILIATAASSASVIVLQHYKAFAQEQSSGLKVVSSNGFNDNNEFSPSYHIVEVQNNGSQTVKFVQVSATLYDKNNQVIGTDFTNTKPSTIEPGMKAPFEILIDKDKVKGGDLGIIDHFATQISTS